MTLTLEKIIESAKEAPKAFSPAFDRQGSSLNQLENFANLPASHKANHLDGIAGGHLTEAIPSFIESQSEKAISGRNNSQIILGRDRPGSRASGYGGKGHTSCGSIDIVTGRGASTARAVDPDTNENLHVDPDFEIDAARIYVSQKTDVDENFKLINSPGAPTSTARASIGMKADTIRIVGRENIRLVTLTNVLNSQGGTVESIGGIDLIAGNMNPAGPDGIQPLVKGDNLIYALEDLMDHIEQLNGIVNGLLKYQNSMNKALTNHFHISPFFAKPTTPSEIVMHAGTQTSMKHFDKTKMSLVRHKDLTSKIKMKYLRPNSKYYINSRYNNTN
jgi:hypothetical protein